MKYTVIWQPRALDRLTEMWMESKDRAAIASASDEIDRRLARDPLHEGEQREGPSRILFVSPLAVQYTVRDDDKLVSVAWVFRFSR